MAHPTCSRTEAIHTIQHSHAGSQLPVMLNWPKEHVATGVPLQPVRQFVEQVALCAVVNPEQLQPSELDTLVAGGLVQAAAAAMAVHE